MIIFDREKLNYFILRILYLIVFIESRRNFCHVIFGDRQEDIENFRSTFFTLTFTPLSFNHHFHRIFLHRKKFIIFPTIWR